MALSRQSKFAAGMFGKVLGILVVGALCAGPPLLAEEAPGSVYVNVMAPDKDFKAHPFTASAICDGRIIFQQDGTLSAPPNKGSVKLNALPVGLCDVRVESEGLITEVKRGIQIFDRDRVVEIVLRVGEGVHIVEVAEGGLAREEVAARLRTLETELEKVKQEIAALSSRPQE